MQALIFADRSGRELHPLDERFCPAMLPLANRPVLEHALLNVVSAGIRKITLVVSSQADRIERHFGKGAMWGVDINYVLTRGEEDPDAVLARIEGRLKAPLLALRGDIFHSFSLPEFIARARTQQGPVVVCHSDGRSVGICLVNRLPASVESLRWPLAAAREQLVEIPGQWSELNGLREYHATSMQLLEEARPDPALRECADDRTLRIGRHAQVDPRNHESGTVLVEEGTLVRKTARLEGPCVIGRHCLIDDQVKIRSSLVLPYTCVGRGLLVENAIVAGDLLIRVDRPSSVRIGDRHVLSPVAQEMSAFLAQLPESLVACVLLLLSAPLWPVALAASVLQSPGKPGQCRLVLSNRPPAFESFGGPGLARAWFWASDAPLLRHLPLLWLVIKGDLRLFGTSFEPTSSSGADLFGESQCSTAGATAGLLGPACLYLPAEAPEEEIRLNEIEFVNRRGCLTLCGRLLSATKLLFSGRAWRPAGKRNPEN